MCIERQQMGVQMTQGTVYKSLLDLTVTRNHSATIGATSMCETVVRMTVKPGFAVRGGQHSSTNQQTRSTPAARPTQCMVPRTHAPTCLCLLKYQRGLATSMCKSVIRMAVKPGCFAIRRDQKNLSPNQQLFEGATQETT